MGGVSNAIKFVAVMAAAAAAAVLIDPSIATRPLWPFSPSTSVPPASVMHIRTHQSIHFMLSAIKRISRLTFASDDHLPAHHAPANECNVDIILPSGIQSMD